jgi:catechol 2,3-dioxygenase-like lactoylglutathione lyase family enzyme
MDTHIDHVVLWVEDPLRSVEFYEHVIGLPGLRVEEFRAGQAPFPSVRVSADSLIDLMPRTAAPSVDAGTRARDTAGYPVNHVCLAMNQTEYDALIGRLEEIDVDTSARMQQTYGAHGLAPHAFYFRDPDNNVIEARYYV